MKPLRWLAGYALIWACWLLDHLPRYVRSIDMNGEYWPAKFYWFGQWGCEWGLANRGFKLMGDK